MSYTDTLILRHAKVKPAIEFEAIILKTKATTKNRVIHASIRRAVASSTAIETGQPIKVLEHLLKTKKSRFQHLKLAN